MMLLLLLWLWVDPNGSEALSQCIVHKDQNCVASLLAKLPEDASPEYLAIAARGFLLIGKPEEALRTINRAVESQPDNYGFLMEQGWLNQRTGDQPAAVHAFLLAAKLKPESPAVFYELGMSFFFAHEYARAARHFNHVLALDSKNDRAAFMLGIVAIWNDQFSEAEARFKQALNLQPNSADYLLHYGVLLAKMEQNERAMEMMLKAEQLDRSNPLTHYNLGRVYRAQNKLTDAQQELEAAVKLRPDFASALYLLSGVYRQSGKQAQAQETLQRFQKCSAEEKNKEEDPIDASVSH